ncbi:MAG: repair protein SbcC/Rad50, partial [Miltoncostaeaceae bacterium]|nr:repair protein SbcC/Rad50 [Miltoncostaeaceae bacterium]
HVVGVRQRALLETASAILGEMTGGRYGFGPSFAIVDRPAGRERSVKTLSGGESFMASLALALGLVELAARSGGRLDALFLDEGFGALDAAALDQALEELERRAEGGRLVGVISHVPAVAERIDDVLLVTRDPISGSSVRRLGDAERDLMLEAEAAAALA